MLHIGSKDPMARERKSLGHQARGHYRNANEGRAVTKITPLRVCYSGRRLWTEISDMIMILRPYLYLP